MRLYAVCFITDSQLTQGETYITSTVCTNIIIGNGGLYTELDSEI